MKPLTIEELKALEVGDWVWVASPHHRDGVYMQIHYNGQKTVQFYRHPNDLLYLYEDYGTKWLAYKNKEQAEAKGEERFTRKDSTYYEKALAKLQELENKIESRQLVELPCEARYLTNYTVTVYIAQDGEIWVTNPIRTAR